MPPEPARCIFLKRVAVFCHPCPLMSYWCHFLLLTQSLFTSGKLIRRPQAGDVSLLIITPLTPPHHRQVERQIYNAKDWLSDELWPWICAGRISLNRGCDACGGNKAFIRQFWRATVSFLYHYYFRNAIKCWTWTPLVEGAGCDTSQMKHVFKEQQVEF